MKKIYGNPTAEIITLTTLDVITLSGWATAPDIDDDGGVDFNEPANRAL